MLINDRSNLKDVLQAIAGTWDLSKDNVTDWKVIELGKLRIFKKVLEAGSTILPNKFLNNRKEVCPAMLFTKDDMKGQMIDLQQTAISVDENCLCLILQF